MTASDVILVLTDQFPDSIQSVEDEPDHVVSILPKPWREVAEFLRDDPRLLFNSLQCVTGVDMGDEETLEVRYNLHSMNLRHSLEVRIAVKRKKPNIPSIEEVWRIGDWFEREVYDMFGIVFKGHRDLRRILCPDDWEGWPLRKDYQVQETYHGIEIPKIKDGWE